MAATRFPRPWDYPGKSSGAGCHFLLQCMKVKSESEVIQSCLTCSDSMDCSPPVSSVHGIFQARVLEWGAIAFSLRTHSYLIIQFHPDKVQNCFPKGGYIWPRKHDLPTKPYEYKLWFSYWDYQRVHIVSLSATDPSHVIGYAQSYIQIARYLTWHLESAAVFSSGPTKASKLAKDLNGYFFK